MCVCVWGQPCSKKLAIYMCVYNSVVTAPWFSCQTSSVLFFFFFPLNYSTCPRGVTAAAAEWLSGSKFDSHNRRNITEERLNSPVAMSSSLHCGYTRWFFFPPPFCSVFPRGFSLANCFSNSFRSFPHASYLIATWVQVWHNTITITQVNEKPPKNKTQLCIIFQAWAMSLET